MAPLIEVTKDILKGLDQLGISYNLKKENNSQPKIKSQEFNKENSIYVPSLEMHFAKERSHLGKNWYESNKLLQENNEFMPTIPQFREFLKYLKNSNNQEYFEIYNNITQVQDPWRAEWLDADFKVIKDKLHINYNHVLDEHGSLIPQNSEVLDKNTLMKDKTPGISLEDWINSNHTEQGLPSKKTKKGDLYYWNPRSDNNSVARFDALDCRAGLGCYGVPSGGNSYLGVRAVRHE